MNGTLSFIPPALRQWMLTSGALLAVWATAYGSPQSAETCCTNAAPTVDEFSDRSLYQVASKWTTDKEKAISLADLKGRPQVVVMFFASCQYACPILVHDLRRIEAALKPGDRGRVGFTLVTIDPRRDTPEALASYRATRGLPDETWSLLHGKPEDIQELAALLGVQYKEEANGQFAHSNLITVLNPKGEIVHQVAGLGQDIQATVRVIASLVAKEPPVPPRRADAKI